MARNSPLPNGTRLKNYLIHKKISSGGFSFVYLAYNENGMPFAIKEFFPSALHLRKTGEYISFINPREKLKFEDGLKAFIDEINLVKNIKHNNIIDIVEDFTANGTHYLVMPYEYGSSLSRYSSTGQLSDESEIVHVVRGIFSAVNELHKNGVIHLDIKPGNVWLRPNKEALLLDFGTARRINDVEASKKQPMYTPGYAAPEQHREYFKPARIGYWTDYYALGASVRSLCEKKTPEPSVVLIDKGIAPNMQSVRLGQFSNILLETADILMEPDWEKRKIISLDRIIKRLNSYAPIRPIKTISNDLFDSIRDEA